MHLLLTDRGSEPFLLQELGRLFLHRKHRIEAPGLVISDFALQPEVPITLVFARQLLPTAELQQAASIRDWCERLFDSLRPVPDQQPWVLHVVPHYGTAQAGQHRCGLIQQTLRDILRRERRHLLKFLEKQPAPFTPAHSIVQLLLTAPDRGYLSVAPSPMPYQLRRVLWPFPTGEIPVASDQAAPSRAFAKLLEAEQRLGESIGEGQTCVDLGAAPGSWTYVALGRGAKVLAVDRAPLRSDLMSHPDLVFRKGDAFTFVPPAPVDWLLCDVIAAPQRTAELLLHWVRGKHARRFIVTIKFKGTDEYGELEHLKYALPPHCAEFYLTHLSANKNEVCAFGKVR